MSVLHHSKCRNKILKTKIGKLIVNLAPDIKTLIRSIERTNKKKYSTVPDKCKCKVINGQGTVQSGFQRSWGCGKSCGSDIALICLSDAEGGN